MNKLDLNALGVEEIDCKSAVEITGGYYIINYGCDKYGTYVEIYEVTEDWISQEGYYDTLYA